MKILSVFSTVQGEGTDVGREAIFVRTAGCSVGCVWCDTKESWEFGKEYETTVDDLVKRVMGISEETGIRSIVLTGGEPMQQSHGEILALFVALQTHGIRRIAVETSGIKVPHETLAAQADLWTVSPKFVSAQPKVRCDARGMQRWAETVPQGKLQFKFVIQNEQDLEEAVSLVRAVPDIREWRIPVIFQPEESVAVEVFHKLTSSWLQKYWPGRSEYDFRLIPQVHKLVDIP